MVALAGTVVVNVNSCRIRRIHTGDDNSGFYSPSSFFRPQYITGSLTIFSGDKSTDYRGKVPPPAIPDAEGLLADWRRRAWPAWFLPYLEDTRSSRLRKAPHTCTSLYLQLWLKVRCRDTDFPASDIQDGA